MLDANFIRDNAEAVKQNCINRNVPIIPVDRVIAFDAKRKELEKCRGETAAKKNDISKLFPTAKTPEDKQKLRDQSAQLDREISTLDAEIKLVEDDLKLNLLQLPNMTHPDAPVGTDAAANKVISRHGEPRKFDFKPRDHVALCEALDL